LAIFVSSNMVVIGVSRIVPTVKKKEVIPPISPKIFKIFV